MKLLMDVAVLAVLFYLLIPLLILFTQRSSASPYFEWLNPQAVPPEVNQFFYESSQAITSLGFTYIGALCMPRQVSNVTPLFLMFANPTTGDAAMAAAMIIKNEMGTQLGTRYVEFTTKWEDTTVVNTNNSRIAGAHVSPPNKRAFRLWELKDIAALYRMHHALRQKYGSPTSQPILPPPGQEIPYLADAMVRDYNYQVSKGRMRLDQANAVYKPTIKGAYLMTWGQMWPFKQLRLAQYAQRMQREMQGASVAVGS